MTFNELAKSRLGFVWNGEVRISYNPIQNLFMLHDPIHWKTEPPEERIDIFREILSDPKCYEAAQEWWLELNREQL